MFYEIFREILNEIFEYFGASFLEVLRWCFVDVAKRCYCCGRLILFICIARVAAGIYPVRSSELLLLGFKYLNIWLFASTFTIVNCLKFFVKISTLIPQVEVGISVFACLTKLTWVSVKYSASVVMLIPRWRWKGVYCTSTESWWNLSWNFVQFFVNRIKWSCIFEYSHIWVLQVLSAWV